MTQDTREHADFPSGGETGTRPAFAFPVVFHVLDQKELEWFCDVFDCTLDALITVTKAAILNHHLDAKVASDALHKRPVILELRLALPRDAVVFYSIEPDGALIRGYGWTPAHERDDGGYFHCDYRLPRPRAIDSGSSATIVPQIVAASLVNILDHFLSDERRDFESVDDDDWRSRHVFNDLKLVDEWLRHIAGTDLIA